MSANELIDRLSNLSSNTPIRMFDCFGQMFTTDFCAGSWRGSYELPAVLVEPVDELSQCYTVKECINNLKDIDGMKVEGYKGGEYSLNGNSTVYLVADDSTSGDAVTIVTILKDGYCGLKHNMY